MTEANEKTIRDVILIFGGFGLFGLIVCVVPNGSLTQTIIGVLMATVLVASFIWFSPLSNPLRRLYRKWKGLK